jgi:hypothetical protein
MELVGTIVLSKLAHNYAGWDVDRHTTGAAEKRAITKIINSNIVFR